jgi:predicted NBD/HSP70 family sugar kinase
MANAQFLAGVNVGMRSIQTIILREEANGALRLMGEHRSQWVLQRSNEELLISRVCDCIEEAIKDAEVSLDEILTIGVASPGQIDIGEGLVLFSPLFDLHERPFPFVERLHDFFGDHPITLLNNDDAYTIGEQRLGMGRNINSFVYLRIGYSIGSGIIINGDLYTGADNLAGVFNHMVVDFHGPPCSCGNNGCLEVFVSKAAMEKKLYDSFNDGRATILASDLRKDPLDINVAVMADAIDQEDLLTRQIVEEAADILGVGIANVINFLNPQRIILGGDVIDEIDLFFEKAVESAKKHALHASRRNVSIVRGMLGTTGGAYGAAVFAKSRLSQM